MTTEKDEQHLKELLITYTRNLQELEKQQAFYSINTPPHILLGIEDLKKKIEELKGQLDQVVSSTKPPPPPELYAHSRYTLGNKYPFTGREADLAKLDTWWATSPDPVMVIEALGGMGKSALTWKWAQKCARQAMQPAGMIWWRFDERGATTEEFIRHALAYVTRQNPDNLTGSYENRVDRLLRELDRANFLLVMDGFERALRAYHHLDSAQLRDEQVPEEADLRDCTELRDAEFLLRLVELKHSKVLISSRLMPHALEVVDHPIAGVNRLSLSGLSPQDAWQMMWNQGVKQADRDHLNAMLRDIGYHPLLIQVISGMVANFRPAPGNFNEWWAEEGAIMNLPALALNERRIHILEHAFKGLNGVEKKILCQAAAFSGPISYQSLSIFNPDLPPKPALPNLPPLPQTRPHPFGSLELAKLRLAHKQAKTAEEKAQLAEQIKQQELGDSKQAGEMHRNQPQLEKELNKVKAQRRKLMAEYEQNYRRSPEYRAARAKFDKILTVLEGRGLLQRDHDRYDMHPVVRGYAFSLLSDEEKSHTFGLIHDYYAAIPTVENHSVQTINDLQDAIEDYQFLLRSGEIDYAAARYIARLDTPLFLLSANPWVIRLLTPFFPGGDISVLPNLRSPHSQYRIINALGIALLNTGQAAQALQLFTLKLNPELGQRHEEMATTLVNYSAALCDLNRLAQAFRAYNLSAQVRPPADKGWADYYLWSYYLLTGQWEQAEAAYAQCQAGPKPASYPAEWQGRVAARYARMQMLRGQEAEAAFTKASELVQISRETHIEEQLYLDRATYYLQTNQPDQAKKPLTQAMEIASKSGHSRAQHLSLLARIEQMQGRKREDCLNLLEKALSDRRLVEGDKAQVYANAAQLYLALNEPERAARNARLAYTLAWADGPPHSQWLPLEQAKAVFAALQLPQPNLPPFQPKQDEKLPYEDKIWQVYLETSKIPATETAEITDFEMTKFNWVQVGLLAAFGLQEDLALRLARKVSALSTFPTAIVVSYSGKTIPLPLSLECDIEHKEWWDLKFDFEEIRSIGLHNVSAMLFISSQNVQGERRFAYVFCLLDKLEQLLAKGNDNEPFNICEYARVTRGGPGEPTQEDREWAGRDWHFSEYTLNLRMFPSR